MRLASIAFCALLIVGSTSPARAQRAPQFADFSVTGVYMGPRAAPILNTPDKLAYRTRIRNAAKLAPNFAGEHVLEYWGCGTSCTNLVVVNSRTGEVFMPPFGAQGGESLYTPETADRFERLQWRLNSRLIVINGRRNEDEEIDAHHYYEFDGRGFRHIRTLPAKPVAQAIVPPSPPSPAQSTVAPSAMPYMGVWASRYADCRDPDQNAVVRFERHALVGYEHRCEFRKLEQTGETWTAETNCAEYDEKWSSRARFSVDGDTMVFQTGQEKPRAMLRCER